MKRILNCLWPPILPAINFDDSGKRSKQTEKSNELAFTCWVSEEAYLSLERLGWKGLNGKLGQPWHRVYLDSVHHQKFYLIVVDLFSLCPMVQCVLPEREWGPLLQKVLRKLGRPEVVFLAHKPPLDSEEVEEHLEGMYPCPLEVDLETQQLLGGKVREVVNRVKHLVTSSKRRHYEQQYLARLMTIKVGGLEERRSHLQLQRPPDILLGTHHASFSEPALNRSLSLPEENSPQEKCRKPLPVVQNLQKDKS